MSSAQHIGYDDDKHYSRVDASIVRRTPYDEQHLSYMCHMAIRRPWCDNILPHYLISIILM